MVVGQASRQLPDKPKQVLVFPLAEPKLLTYSRASTHERVLAYMRVQCACPPYHPKSGLIGMYVFHCDLGY